MNPVIVTGAAVLTLAALLALVHVPLAYTGPRLALTIAASSAVRTSFSLAAGIAMMYLHKRSLRKVSDRNITEIIAVE